MSEANKIGACSVHPQTFRDEDGNERRLRVVTHEAWRGGYAYMMPLDAAAPALRLLDRRGLLSGGAYFLAGPKLGNGGTPVYVGRSHEMTGRLRSHMTDPARLPVSLASGVPATWFDRLVYVVDYEDPFWGSCLDWVESHMISYLGSLTSVTLVNRNRNLIGAEARNLPADALPGATLAVERLLDMLPALGLRPNAPWAHEAFVERMRATANHLLIRKTCLMLPEDLLETIAA